MVAAFTSLSSAQMDDSWVQEANFFLHSFFISKPHAIPRDQASLSSFFTGMAEAIAFRPGGS
jgi:hypothetical protein